MLLYRRLVAGVLAIVLTGCSVFSDGFSATIKKEEQETEYSSVCAEIIEFGRFKKTIIFFIERYFLKPLDKLLKIR